MDGAADWNQPEETDGVRLTFNIWPNSKLEATKCVVPFAALYTPNKRLPNMPVGGLPLLHRALTCRALLHSRYQAWPRGT